MSTPLAGKFQDHYDVLGIDPRSDSETLQSAYAELARKYHPNNPDTGDQEAFDAVNAAYEVLSDPAQRFAFDNLKGIGEDASCPQFSGTDFSNRWARMPDCAWLCCASYTSAARKSP
jgi:curved DNA-binding protein CbpA